MKRERLLPVISRTKKRGPWAALWAKQLDYGFVVTVLTVASSEGVPCPATKKL